MKKEQVNHLLALAQVGELVGVAGERVRRLVARDRLGADDVRAIEDHAGEVSTALLVAYEAAIEGGEHLTDRSQERSPDEAFRDWLFRPRGHAGGRRGR